MKKTRMKDMNKPFTFTDYGFYPFSVGDLVVLVEKENQMTGDVWYEMVPDDGKGIAGNLNFEDDYCYHGYRGSNDDVTRRARGCRRILEIGETVNIFSPSVHRMVTVSEDLKPDED